MTKYTRLTGKVFGSSATATGDDPEIGQFGSALAGTYNGTTDVATIQSLPAWQKGFIGCVTPNTQFPPLPEMTGVGKVLSYQICYLLQKGVPAWDSGTIYYTNDWCSYNDKLYISKTDENLNNLPTDTTNWKQFTGGFARNFGEIVTSSLPIVDDNTLHLADGSLLSASNYPEFVSYVANLYNSLPTGDFSQAVQIQNLTSYGYWHGVTYGNGKYLAVSSGNYYSTSTDGTNWETPVSITTTDTLSDVTFDGSNFVAICTNGEILTSSDGISWATGVTISTNGFYAIAYSNSKYVALGASGIFTSSDLTSWTRTYAVSLSLYQLSHSLAYVNNKFIASIIVHATNEHIIVTSEDGETWTEYNNVNLPITRNQQKLYYTKIFFKDNKYQIIDNQGYISTTTGDFTNWTTPTQNTNLGNNSWYTLTVNDLDTEILALGTGGYVSLNQLPFTNVFTTEANWQATYTAYGECGKYVYNSNANTVRIPAVNSYFTNTTNPNNLGELIPASLPNIKGVVAASEKLYKSGTSVSDYGAFNNYAQNVVSGQSDNTHFDNDLWNFDASRVSSVYSDTATTVNTQSIKQLVYIVVAK